MSCPLNRNRWAGSGYVKQPETAGSKDMDARVAAMMAERELQDAKSFPGAQGAQCIPKEPPTKPTGGNGGNGGCSGGTCPLPKKPAK
jgi:hypothetical protein